MPRATQSQLHGMSYAPSDTPFQSSIQRVQASGVDQRATALVQALGLAGNIGQQVFDGSEKRNAQQGAVDAERGTVDQNKLKQSQAYEKAAVETQTAAQMVEAEGEFRQWYDQNFDKDKGTPQDLNDHLNQFFQERFGHINDKLQAGVLIPRMQQFRQKMLDEQQQNTRAAVQNDQVSSVATLIRDSVNNNKPVDLESMKQQLVPMFGMGGATKQLTNIIGTMAVERAQPNLIDALVPEKWADGTPGPRSTPELANQLNQYRAYAESAYKQMNAEAKTQAKLKQDQGLVEIQSLALSGNTAAAMQKLQEVSNLGVLTPEEQRAVANFVKGERNDYQGQTFDNSAYIQWRSNLMEDPRTYGDPMYIIRNVDHLFAPGDHRQQSVQQAMDDVSSAKRAQESLAKNGLAKAYRTQLVTKYKPDNISTPADKQLYSEGLFAYDSALAQNKSPDEAHEAAMNVFNKKDDNSKQAVGKDVGADVKAFTGNTLDMKSFRAHYGTPDGVASIRSAMDKGSITPDDAVKALQALK